MKAQLHVPLGSKKLVVEGQGTQQQVMQILSFWSTLPEKCGKCDSPNIELSYRKPKGYDYYGLRCAECNASINFGQAKEGGNFFIKYDANWEVYKAQPLTDEKRDRAPDDDIPF